MSIIVPYNGQNYIVPTPGEVGWGSNLDSFFVAISAGSLQKIGGNFTLTAPVNFGPSFGIIAKSLTSTAPNPSTGSFINMNFADTVSWRNNANSANLMLQINALDQLTFNGVVLEASGGPISLPDGSAGSPSLSFQTNPNDGLFHSTHLIGVAINGNSQVAISASDITTSVPVIITASGAPLVVNTTQLVLASSGFLGIGTATPANTLHVFSAANPIMAESTFAQSFTGGRILSLGLISRVRPNNTTTMAVGDYLGAVNLDAWNSSNAEQEYAEFGAVLTNVTAGSETANVLIMVRNAGETIPVNAVARFMGFGTTGGGNKAGILRIGAGENITASVTSGGAFIWSNDTDQAGFGGGGQFNGTTQIARSTASSSIQMGTNVPGSTKFFNDTGLTPGSSFTPTERLSIDPTGHLSILATSNQLVLGASNTVTLTAPAPATSRTYTIPDIAGTAVFLLAPSATGTSNQILGTNNAGTANEFKTLSGTANQVILTPGTGTLTFSLPQNIATSSTPTFAQITLNDTSSPKVIIQPASGTVTTSEFHLFDSTSTGLNIQRFGSGIISTINGRSATSATLANNSGTLFINSNLISIGLANNTTEIATWDSTGLHLVTPLEVVSGGTGSGSHTAYALLAGGTTSTGAIQSLTSVGTVGQILTSNGASALPTFQTPAASGTVNSGTVQRLALYASSTNAVSDTDVQNGHNITIALATQASRSTDLTITIPNPGNAIGVAHILMDSDTGAYTIDGSWNLSQTLTISPTTNQLILGSTRTVTISAPTPATTSRTVTIPDLAGDYSVVGTLGAQSIAGIKTFTDAPLIQKSVSGAQLLVKIFNSSTSASSDAVLELQTNDPAAGDPYTEYVITGGGIWSAGADNSDGDNYKVSRGSALGTNDDIIISTATDGVSIKGTNTTDSASAGYVGEYVESVVASTNAGTSGQYTDFTSVSLTAGDWNVTLNGQLDNNSAVNTGCRIGISTTSGNSSSGLTVGSNAGDFGKENLGIGTVGLSIANYRMSLSTTTTVYYKFFASYTGGPPKLAGRISARRER